MSTLYLMRHGETLFNIQGKIQGWCDSPLTERGIHQAELAKQYFSYHGIRFDHAYASTAERASDTLEIVTDHKMPYTRVKSIREWGFGVYEGKDEFLHPAMPIGNFYKQFGGEGEEEVTVRIVKALQDIMSQPEHETVLAVSHGGACSLFLKYWSIHDKPHPIQQFGNCTIFQYEYRDGIFICQDIINPMQFETEATAVRKIL